MKKPVFSVFGILAAVLVLQSCESMLVKDTVIWDDSKPEESCVEIRLRPGITVTSYNGVAVEWKPYTQAILPAGNIILTMTLDYYYGYTHYSGESIFLWKFEPGQKYFLRAWERDDKPGILIEDLNNKLKLDEYPFFTFPQDNRQRVLE